MGRTLNPSTRDQFMGSKPDICELCGATIEIPTDISEQDFANLSPTVDHIIEWSAGGSNSFDNLAKTHAICNYIRGAQHLLRTLEKRRQDLGLPEIMDETLFVQQRLEQVQKDKGTTSHMLRSTHRDK